MAAVRAQALGAAQGWVVVLAVALAVQPLALAAAGLGLGSAVGFAGVRVLAGWFALVPLVAQLGLCCCPLAAAHCLPRFHCCLLPSAQMN